MQVLEVVVVEEVRVVVNRWGRGLVLHDVLMMVQAPWTVFGTDHLQYPYASVS